MLIARIRIKGRDATSGRWSKCIGFKEILRPCPRSQKVPKNLFRQYERGGNNEGERLLHGAYEISVIKKRFSKNYGPAKVIDIGYSKNLVYRIGIFISAALGFDTLHSAGNAFYRLSIKKQVHLFDLALRYKLCRKGRGEKEEAKRTDQFNRKLGRDDKIKIVKFRKKVGITKQGLNTALPLLMSRVPGGCETNFLVLLV